MHLSHNDFFGCEPNWSPQFGGPPYPERIDQSIGNISYWIFHPALSLHSSIALKCKHSSSKTMHSPWIECVQFFNTSVVRSYDNNVLSLLPNKLVKRISPNFSFWIGLFVIKFVQVFHSEHTCKTHLLDKADLPKTFRLKTFNLKAIQRSFVIHASIFH